MGNQFNIVDFLPMPPWLGPPFPQGLSVYWPWVQSQGESLFLPPLPKITPFISPTETITSEPSVTRYENIEEVELVDIDKDLLMPKKIIIHRKSKELK